MALTQVSTGGIEDGTITGSDLATNIDLVDDQKLRLGTGNDFEIYFNSTQGIVNSGANNLLLLSNIVQISTPAGSKYFKGQSGVAELYHSDSLKLQTTSTGASVTGNLNFADYGYAIFGAGSDLNIYHNVNKSVILNTTGFLELRSDQFRVITEDQQHTYINIPTDEQGVELYYDDSKKFETTSTGATVTGDLTATGRLLLGTTTEGHTDADDLTIATSSGYAGITLRSPSDQGGAIYFSDATSGAGEYDGQILYSQSSRTMQLITANNPRLTLDSSGNLLSGTTSSSLLSNFNTNAGGLVLDDIGSGATAFLATHGDKQIFLGNDTSANYLWGYSNHNLLFGTNNQTRLTITSDGNVGIGTTSPATKLHINGGTYAAPTGGNDGFTQLVISNQSAGQGAGIGLLGAGNMVTFIHFGDSDDANVGAIVYNNVVDSMQFYVNASERMNIDSSGNLNINKDSGRLRLGAGADLQLYHDGSESVIGNSTGTLQFLSPNEIRYRATTHHFISYGNDETMAKFIDDGAVELYHDNTKRFETVSNGSSINGKTFCKGHNLGNGDASVEVHLRSDTNQYITGLHFAGHGQINGSTYTAARFIINGSGGTYGTITYTSGGTSYNSQSSDKRSKKNFEDWTDSVLPDFKSLKPQLFNYILQEDGEIKYKGYTAQDNVAAFPEAYPLVDDRYMFNPSGMVHYLMKAMQELVSKVEVLETEVAALKAS